MSGHGWPERVDVLGVEIDGVTLSEAVDRSMNVIRGARQPQGYHVITANPELVMCTLDGRPVSRALKAIFEQASLVVADGIGVVWASRIFGTPLPERVPGIELAECLVAACGEEKRRVFFLGGEAGVADEAADRLIRRHPGLRVAGTHHGYFSEDEGSRVARRIAEAEADLLLVGLGAPKQELWIAAHRVRLRAKVIIGVGGALDVFAGRTRRAPVAVQRLGLEWAYRLAKEPRRVGRMAALPRFVARVLWRQWQREE